MLPKRILFLILCLMLTAYLPSCCRQHFLKNFDQVQMKSSQLILEAHGDTVPFEMQVFVPKGLLCGGLQLRLTPFLKQDSLKTPFSLYQKSTEKEEVPTFTITGAREGRYTFKGYFMNFPQLQNSHFVVEWYAQKSGQTARLSERLIGYGISQVYPYSGEIISLVPGFDPAQVRRELLSRPSQNSASYYLLAIMSARLYDQDGVRNYLELALSHDPSLKARLEKEVDFIGYRKEQWFQQIIR